MRRFWPIKPALLFGVLTALVLWGYSQAPLQVVHAVLTADEGSPVPVATALFGFTNSEGVLVWEAAVAAVEPISSGRIFVDQPGGRTALAILNPAENAVTASLILRDSSGEEVDQKDQVFAAGQHQSLFVDQLFSGLEAFTGSLPFQTPQAEEKLAAVTLRQNTNLQGEPFFCHPSGGGSNRSGVNLVHLLSPGRSRIRALHSIGPDESERRTGRRADPVVQ